MNYFELYPGDYLKATQRLTLLEHGAYLRLLMAYYGEEEALPADLGELYVTVSAISSADKAAVRKVADRFFPVAADGLRHNDRADAEIEKAQKRIAAAKANGAKGGRKPKAEQNPEETQRVTHGATQPLTHSGEALHTPHATKEPEPANAGLPPAAPDGRPPVRPDCPQLGIVALYHEILPQLRRVQTWNETRRRLLGRRWAEEPERQTLDWWREFFAYVGQSKFLTGQVTGRDGRPFDCDLEWLIRPTNFAKVLEGKYEDAAA